jgi:hypothetical protein
MGLDIRLPLGLMFAAIGVLLVGYGLLGHATATRPSSININLWWGLAMLAFGAVMLVLSRRGTAAMRPTAESPEGQQLEEAERNRGL